MLDTVALAFCACGFVAVAWEASCAVGAERGRATLHGRHRGVGWHAGHRGGCALWGEPPVGPWVAASLSSWGPGRAGGPLPSAPVLSASGLGPGRIPGV